MRKFAVLALVAGISLAFVTETAFARGGRGGGSRSHHASSSHSSKSVSKSHSVSRPKTSSHKAASSKHSSATQYNLNVKTPTVNQAKPVRDTSTTSRLAPDSTMTPQQVPQKQPISNGLTPEQIAQQKADELAKQQAAELAKQKAIQQQKVLIPGSAT